MDLTWIQRAWEHPDFWKYASIPIVAGIVGWATNWVAVKMTFRPLRFVGIPPLLGWQGIIPSKARKMAEIFVDRTMVRLGTLREFFEELQPHRIADQIVYVLGPRMRETTDALLHEHHARLWRTLPQALKEPIYRRVDDALPRLVHEMMDEVGERVEELLDLKQMITERLVGSPQLLNRLFLESGDREFRFIVRSGFTFGFLFGLVQLAVWIWLPQWWVLPLFGLIVGWATNWIALNIIFRPLNPVRLGPWTLHGLFLKRQPEVAGAWCRLVTREIMTVRAVADNFLHGTHGARTRELIQRRIRPIVDEAMADVRPLAEAAVGAEGIARLRVGAGHRALLVSAAPFNDPAFVEERAEAVEAMLRRRMIGLPSVDFQELLRPCFQEDEWKLILLGAALGLAAGTAQLFLVFGGI